MKQRFQCRDLSRKSEQEKARTAVSGLDFSRVRGMKMACIY